MNSLKPKKLRWSHLAILMALGVLLPIRALAVPSIVGAAQNINGQTTNPSTITWNYQVATGFTNNLLLINVELQSGNTVTTMTYNGIAMTMAIRSATGPSGADMETWYLANPPTGINPLVINTTNTYIAYSVIAAMYSGVNQSSPIGATGSGSTASTTSTYTSTITGVTSNTSLLEDFMTINSAPTVTFTSGNTATIPLSSNYQPDPYFGSTEPAASAGTDTLTYGLSWTGNAAGNQSVEIKAAITVTFTPTPSMPLVKTVNVPNANVGDTVTYCVSWTNNSGSLQSFSVWDTVSPFISYLGCLSGCAQTAGVVSWSVVGAAAGASGTFCFWGTVAGYPRLPSSGTQTATLFFPLEP